MVTDNTFFSYEYKFIGRKSELAIFNELVKKDGGKTALYIEAEGGIGKTKLINEFVAAGRELGCDVGPYENQGQNLIDFFTPENRTIYGVRESIAQRVGDKYFAKYFKKAQELNNLSSLESKNKEGRMAALDLELRALFFDELEYAVSQKKTPVILFFDTFEKVSNNEAGKWFILDFVPFANKLGIQVIFAGRKENFSPPQSVARHELKGFDKTQEYAEYFKERASTLLKNSMPSLSETQEALYNLSSGKPLLVEIMQFLGWGDFSKEMQELAQDENTKHVFETQLVSKFVNNENDDPFFKLILEMAYLKHRYNRQIFEHRQKHFPGIKDWAHASERLKSFPFVKHYSKSDSFVLHEEFQRMIEMHGRGVFREAATELYEDIVKKLYDNMISQAQSDDLKYLLQVEQLSYILNVNGNHDQIAPDYALAKEKISQYNDVRSHTLGGYMISEISYDALKNFQPAESLSDVLRIFGTIAQRVYRYEEAQIYWNGLVEYYKKTADHEKQVEALLSVFNNAWRSNPYYSFEVLKEAHAICEVHARSLLPRVLNSMGFNYARFHNFDEAINNYLKALSVIHDEKQNYLKGIILNNLGVAYLEAGKMPQAKAHLDASKRIRLKMLEEAIENNNPQGVEAAEIWIGYSFVNLGKSARYSDHLDEAERNYSEAIGIFDKFKNYSAKANTLLERGETLRRMAKKNYENNSNDFARIRELENKAETDIQISTDLIQKYGLTTLLDTAYRRKGRILHDKGIRARSVNEKLKCYDEAQYELEKGLEFAKRTKDVREELEYLRELAFLADDRVSALKDNQDQESMSQKEMQRLDYYITLFEEGLRRHKNDTYRLYNYEVFESLLALEKAAFSYEKGEMEQSLELYLIAFVGLAKSPGYGVSNYLMYIPHLARNIERIKDTDLRKAWCGRIIQVWKEEKLDQTREELMAKIEVILLGVIE